MPQTNKETKNSLSLRKHAKQLRELHQFNLELTGDIVKILENPQEWAEKTAEEAIMGKLDVYKKAKKLGEEFAREITT